MSLFGLLAIIYFGFTVLLMFLKKRTGNLFMIFGSLTFLFILTYGFIPAINPSMLKLGIYILFSLVFLLFGIMNGTLLLLLKNYKRYSVFWAIFSTCILMIFLFNLHGMIIYLYVPVLLYAVQKKITLYTASFPKS